MTVYIIPRNKYAGFLGGLGNSLGEGAAGIVTNLLGQQISGIMDRAKNARDQKIYGKFLGEMDALGDASGLTKEQMMYSALRNKYYPLLSEDSRNRWQAYIDEHGINQGLAELGTGLSNKYGSDSAGIVTGMSRAQYDPTVQRGLLDVAIPKLESETLDLGGNVETRQRNPYKEGIVTNIIRPKAVSPDAQLSADVTREGYKNRLDVTKAQNNGALAAAKIEAGSRAGGRGGGASQITLQDLMSFRTQLAERRSQLSPKSKEDKDELTRIDANIRQIDLQLSNALVGVIDKDAMFKYMVDNGASPEQARAAVEMYGGGY